MTVSDEVLKQIGRAVLGMLAEGQPVYVGRRGITIDGDIEISDEVKEVIASLPHWMDVAVNRIGS